MKLQVSAAWIDSPVGWSPSKLAWTDFTGWFSALYVETSD